VALGCLAIATPLMVIVEVAPSVPLVRGSLIGLWLLIAPLSITAIRRAHNSEYNLFWAFVMVAGPAIGVLGMTLRAAGIDIPWWLSLLGILGAVACATLGVMLVFLGTTSTGPNRFGADPDRARASGRARGRAQEAGEPLAVRRPTFDPRGRTSRAGFIAQLVLSAICAAPLIGMVRSDETVSPVWLGMGIVAFGLGAVLLLIASIRRAHDIGATAQVGLILGSGPLFCAPLLFIESIAVTPAFFVGAILTLCLLAVATFDGQPRPNRHGPDPVRNRPPPKARGANSAEFSRLRRKMKTRAAPTLLLADTDEPGFSKLGGDPELPTSATWPSNTRGPLSFLAQVDLKAADAAGGPEWLPQAGALYLFAEADGGGGDGRAAVVLHAPDLSNVEPNSPPADLPKFGARFEERRVGLQAFTSLPSLDGLGVDVRELEVEDDELDELSDLPASVFPEVPLHRLGGHPNEIQESRMALECELGSRGLDTETIFDGEVEPKILRASKSWRLLFQIDSDPDIGMSWGDGGMLYIFIREADARAGNFSRTWLISQSH
jgi:uncharacterized protein YwqG/uncharacterized membrane protein YhaH (DUF805 family)